MGSVELSSTSPTRSSRARRGPAAAVRASGSENLVDDAVDLRRGHRAAAALEVPAHVCLQPGARLVAAATQAVQERRPLLELAAVHRLAAPAQGLGGFRVA